MPNVGIFTVLHIVLAGVLIECNKTNMAQQNEQENRYRTRREEMVYQQIAARGIKDDRVLQAMLTIPRHKFVPNTYLDYAYDDGPLPIGSDQTISQPYIVALMTDRLRLRGTERVLEIGSGSGYQAAVLSLLAKEVYTIEIVHSLHLRAKRTIEELGIKNVFLKSGDGYRGWPEHAPFDAIMLTAAPREIPRPLLDQLNDPGILILPQGEDLQELVLVEKRDGRISRQIIEYVRFVPMTGEAQRRR
jgi:protein-L-isoaspartate(D-aspartate) O-methyltransferase